MGDDARPKLKTPKTVETKKPTGPADLVRGKPKKKKAWEEEENSDDDEEDAEVTHEDIEKWIQNEKNREKEEAEAARKKIEDAKRKKEEDERRAKEEARMMAQREA